MRQAIITKKLKEKNGLKEILHYAVIKAQTTKLCLI